MLEERLKEQTEEHHGGNYWIGTGEPPLLATPATIPRHPYWRRVSKQVGGQVAGERHFEISATTPSSTPASSRWLCANSGSSAPGWRDPNRTGYRWDGGGYQQERRTLELVWERPRENAIKVLLVMDSGVPCSRTPGSATSSSGGQPFQAL